MSRNPPGRQKSVKKPLPRVLLLSAEPPHLGAAGAVVLFRLFQQYPQDQLLVVSNHLPPPDAARLACRYQHLPLAVDRLSRTRLWRWRAILRSFGASRLVSLQRVDEALGRFEPDVVLTLMQDSWCYDLAARYAAARGLPLVLFVHDLAHGFEPVPRLLRRRQLARDEVVFRQAEARLCVSRPMADYFQALFAVSAEHLPPPRSEQVPAQPPENCRGLKGGDRLTLGYAGGLHYGYGEQLLRMLPVLRATGTIIHVFGHPPQGGLLGLRDATDVLHFHGHAPSPEAAWKALLETCDVVLQPYLNPPGPHELQYRTHFPSKLGDALSLGLPLLITGEPSASGVAWCLQRPDSALCVIDPDDEALRGALLRLKDDPELRVRLAAGAQRAATALDAPPLRARLHDLLIATSYR